MSVSRHSIGATLLVMALLASCTHDWDLYDPRLGNGSGGGDVGGQGGEGLGGAGAMGGAGGAGGEGGTLVGGMGGSGGALPTAPILRSVGPGNALALAVGASNALEISGMTASFANPLPDSVGVGDVLQYDSDDDGDIDADDALAFIHARTSSTEYSVSDAAGGVPPAVSGDVDWSLYRAYTSLADAVAGTENPSIASPLSDFDAWVDGKDLVAADQSWNIACYADGTDVKPVAIQGWVTSPNNVLRIFTPTSADQVGTSQRHDGTAGSGYVIQTSTAPPPLAHVISVQSDHVHLEGLEITGWVNDAMSNSFEGVHVGADGTLLSEMLIHDDLHPDTTNPNADAIGLGGLQDGWAVTVRNSIIYNISRGAINYQGGGAPIITVENCTIINSGTSGMAADGEGGIAMAGSALALVTVNNTISMGSQSGADFTKLGDNWGTSSNNISSDSSAPGANSQANLLADALFVSTTLGAEDFHLMAAVAAVDAGKDLIAFSNDIDGDERPAGGWDVGADEAP